MDSPVRFHLLSETRHIVVSHHRSIKGIKSQPGGASSMTGPPKVLHV